MGKAIGQKSWSLVIVSLSLLVFASCSKDDEPTSTGPDLGAERRAIESAYQAWSNALIAQDYSKAISLTVPGGNGYNRTNRLKERWDDGWQEYDDIEYVEAWLDEEDLAKGYGEAVGNLQHFQYKPSVGSQTSRHGFYSSCRKIDGQWKINGINSNEEVDWWR